MENAMNATGIASVKVWIWRADRALKRGHYWRAWQALHRASRRVRREVHKDDRRFVCTNLTVAMGYCEQRLPVARRYLDLVAAHLDRIEHQQMVMEGGEA